MSPSDARAANLEDLIRRYGDRAATARAIEGAQRMFLRASLPAALARRGLGTRRMSPEHQALREALLRVFRFYAVLEVASMARVVPELPAEITGDAATLLRVGGVARFADDEGLELVRLFQERLDGVQAFEEEDPVAAGRLFTAFLGLDEDCAFDSDVQAFLRAVERDDRDPLAAVRAAFESPETYLAALAGSRREASAGVHGVHKLLAFVQELSALLADAGSAPLVAAGLWHCYAGIFALLTAPSEGRAILDHALSRFRIWNRADADAHTRARAAAAIDALERLLDDLLMRRPFPDVGSTGGYRRAA